MRVTPPNGAILGFVRIELEEGAVFNGRTDEERRRRRETAESFRRWRDGGFAGPPPA